MKYRPTFFLQYWLNFIIKIVSLIRIRLTCSKGADDHIVWSCVNTSLQLAKSPVQSVGTLIRCKCAHCIFPHFREKICAEKQWTAISNKLRCEFYHQKTKRVYKRRTRQPEYQRSWFEGPVVAWPGPSSYLPTFKFHKEGQLCFNEY